MVARSRDPAGEEARLGVLLSPLAILELDSRAAVAFGHIVGLLQERGTPVGDMDAPIASVCVVHGQSIVTRNARHFDRVPGLEVVTY